MSSCISNSELKPDSQNRVIIAGTGSFALEFFSIFQKHKILVQYFIDEFATSPFYQRPVYRAAETENIDRDYPVFVAISDPKHQQACLSRLNEQGFKPEQLMCLKLESGSELRSCFNFIDYMLRVDKKLAMTLLKSCSSDIVEWQLAWFHASSSLHNYDISLRLTGAADGHFNHLNGVYDKIRKKYSVEVISDSPSTGVTHNICSRLAMRQLNCNLAITASLTPCCPTGNKQLTMLHTLYDSALYKGAERTLRNGAKHFVAVASKPLMRFFQNLCRREKLEDVVLIPAGYPKLDSAISDYSEKSDPKQRTLLYAPTPFGHFSKLEMADCHSIMIAEDLIHSVLNECNNSQVIVRPYPDDLKNIKEIKCNEIRIAFEQLIELCKNNPRVYLDDNKTHRQSYQRSHILLTDLSSTAYSFAFTTLKPAIFLNNESTERTWRGTSYIHDRHKIGRVCKTVEEVKIAFSEMTRLKTDHSKNITKLREQQVYNLGSSAKYLAECVDKIYKGEQKSDWWSLSSKKEN